MEICFFRSALLYSLPWPRLESSIQGDGLRTGASLILIGATVSRAEVHKSWNQLTELLILEDLGIVLNKSWIICFSALLKRAAECSLKMWYCMVCFTLVRIDCRNVSKIIHSLSEIKIGHMQGVKSQTKCEDKIKDVPMVCVGPETCCSRSNHLALKIKITYNNDLVKFEHKRWNQIWEFIPKICTRSRGR